MYALQFNFPIAPLLIRTLSCVPSNDMIPKDSLPHFQELRSFTQQMFAEPKSQP